MIKNKPEFNACVKVNIYLLWDYTKERHRGETYK